MQKSDRTTKRIIKTNSRGRCLDGAPNPVDVYVGQRIKMRRQFLKMSQEKLATLMGLTFQQLQKYERGYNRIGASRLWDMSKLLKVDVNFFFEDMPQEIANQSPRRFVQHPGIIDDSDNDPLPTCPEKQMRRRSCCLIILKFVTAWLPAIFLTCFKFWQCLQHGQTSPFRNRKQKAGEIKKSGDVSGFFIRFYSRPPRLL